MITGATETRAGGKRERRDPRAWRAGIPRRRPRPVRALRALWLRGARRATRERLRWAIRIRGAVIALFLVVAVAARWAGVLGSLVPALAAAAAGTAMNLAAAARVRRWRRIPAMLAWTGLGDAVLITYVVAATGGTASPFLLLYVVQVLTTALVVGLPAATLAGASGVALLASMVLGRPLGDELGVAPAGAERWIWLASLGLTLLLLVFIGGYLTRRLARSERALADAHRRLQGAHAALQAAYDRLARAEARLVAAEKLRALGVLVAGVAHELGNPLTVLAGNLEPLAEALEAHQRPLRALAAALPPPGADAGADAARHALAEAETSRREAPVLLANCREAVGRAAVLLAQLRSFGRGSHGAALHPAPLRPGLESTLALVRHRLPPGVRVHETYEEVPDVACVPAELNQVFMNLLLNAADALRPSGNLWIALRRRDGEICVTVRDDGAGIPPALLPRVFDPFFTTKDVGKGTGLGLAISHAIVSRHGGRLEAEAGAGGGAVFTVRLPAPDDTVETEDARRPAPPA